MLQNISFTDPQSITHTDATFKVRRADMHENTSSFIRLNSEDFATYEQDSPDPSKHVVYSVYYWPSESARLEGSTPYTLTNDENNGVDFNFNADSTYDGLDLESIVEKHLTEIILPPMQE